MDQLVKCFDWVQRKKHVEEYQDTSQVDLPSRLVGGEFFLIRMDCMGEMQQQ